MFISMVESEKSFKRYWIRKTMEPFRIRPWVASSGKYNSSRVPISYSQKALTRLEKYFLVIFVV